MKKIIKPVFITFIILAALTAGGVYLLSRQESGPTGDFQARMSEEQRDLHTERAYQYDIGTRATLLATSGDEKNVLNFNQSNVYQVANSNAARERLDRLIKRTDATFESPIIALNPFGTNANSFYFYFDTSYRCVVRYSITVEDESVYDHIRYVNNGQEDNLARNHEFVVSGLIPGRTNFIVLELLDSTGAVRESQTYQYAAPDCGLPDRISMQEGHSKETAGSGLYFVFPSGHSQIAAYDNQGILRNVTVTESGHGKKLLQSAGSFIYQVSDHKVAKVSPLGRVTGVVQIKGYGKIRDFSYDGFNEIYSIGTKKKQDVLLATSFETGKDTGCIPFSEENTSLLSGRASGGGVWLTAASPSGLLCMDAITSASPKIALVLGKKKAWKKIVGKKKVAEDKNAAAWDTSQAFMIPVEEDPQKQSMLVQKEGKATAVQWQGDAGKKQTQVFFSSETGGGVHDQIQVQGEHYIRGASLAQGNYAEMDKKQKVIRQFSFGSPLDSVMKLTLEGTSFFGI